METRLQKSAMVVNLHFTDFCNCRCSFCHSRFQRSRLGLAEWEKIIDNIVGDLNVRSLVDSRFRDEFAKIGFNFDAYLKRYVQAA